MKALLFHEPGGPNTLWLIELAEPVAGPGELLIRVRAAAVIAAMAARRVIGKLVVTID